MNMGGDLQYARTLSLDPVRQKVAISLAIFSQIFFLVILFAAYNGLVFLPVLLSVAGPGQRKTEKPKSASKDVAMVDVNKKLNSDSVQKEEQGETEVKERLLENGEAVA